MSEESDTARRRCTAAQLGRHWPCGPAPLLELPFPSAPDMSTEPLPPQSVVVRLPNWARDVSVGGDLVVPARFLLAGPHVARLVGRSVLVSQWSRRTHVRGAARPDPFLLSEAVAREVIILSMHSYLAGATQDRIVEIALEAATAA